MTMFFCNFKLCSIICVVLEKTVYVCRFYQLGRWFCLVPDSSQVCVLFDRSSVLISF